MSEARFIFEAPVKPISYSLLSTEKLRIQVQVIDAATIFMKVMNKK